MESTAAYSRAVTNPIQTGSKSTDAAGNDALYIVGLVILIGIAIQLMLCFLFAYKFCKAKFRPDPPPYTPPATNLSLQQQNQESLEPPPAYVAVEDEETPSAINIAYQSTEGDSRSAPDPWSTVVSGETQGATYSEHDGRLSGVTQDVTPPNEEQEDLHATVEAQGIDMNRMTRYTTSVGQHLSLDHPTSHELYLRCRDNERTSTNTREHRLNPRPHSTTSTEDIEVDIDGTTTLDEEGASPVLSSSAASIEDTNNVESLSINTRENTATWTATQEGLEYMQTCTPLQVLPVEVHGEKDTRSLNDNIENVTVGRSSAVA